MSINHPGVAHFQRAAQLIEDPNKLRHRLGEERWAINKRLAEQDPQHRDPEMIRQLRTLEVAAECANWSDLNHPNARAALRKAVEGKSPTDNPRDSLLFERQHEALQQQVCDRITIKIDHGPR